MDSVKFFMEDGLGLGFTQMFNQFREKKYVDRKVTYLWSEYFKKCKKKFIFHIISYLKDIKNKKIRLRCLNF